MNPNHVSRTLSRALVACALCLGSLAAEVHQRAVTVSPGSPSFSVDFGTVSTGDMLALTITGLPEGLKSAAATPSAGPGGWSGGLPQGVECGTAVFTATIPSDFSGTHTGNFSGEFCLSGEGSGEPPTWSGDSIAAVCETTIDQNTTGGDLLEVTQTADGNTLVLTATSTDPKVVWRTNNKPKWVSVITKGNKATITFKAEQGRVDPAAQLMFIEAAAKRDPDCNDSRFINVLAMQRGDEIDSNGNDSVAIAGIDSDDDKTRVLNYIGMSDRFPANYDVFAEASGKTKVSAKVELDGKDEPMGTASAAVVAKLFIDGSGEKVATALAVGDAQVDEVFQFEIKVPIKGAEVGLSKTVTRSAAKGDSDIGVAAISGVKQEKGVHQPGAPLSVSARFFAASAAKLQQGIQGWVATGSAEGGIDWDLESDDTDFSPVY